MPQDPDRRAIDQAFGAVLRTLREEQGLSQEALGNQTGTGRTYVSQLERAEKGATIKTLFRLARQLDVRPSEVIRLLEAELEMG